MWARAVLAIPVAIVGLGMSSPQGEAQDIVRITDPSGCEHCVITLEREAVLKPPDDGQVLFPAMPRPVAVRDRQDRYIVGSTRGDAVLAVFGPSGEFIHSYGRQGGGPSEFLGLPAPMVIRVLEDDRLLVAQGPYIHFLEPGARGTESKRRTKVRPSDLVALKDGRLVAQAYVYESQGHGTPLQVMRRTGDVVRGLGQRSSDAENGRSYFTTTRTIADAADGMAVWSSYVNRYEISRFSPDGQEELRVVRDSKWFRPYQDPIVGEVFAEPQRPRVDGIFDAGSGILWVLITRGDRDFRPVVDLAGRSEGRLEPSNIDFNALLDTTLEVLDLPSGALLARKELDGYYRLMDAPGATAPVLFKLVRDEWGGLYGEVHQARMSMHADR